MSFALILVILSAVSGVLALADVVYFEKKRQGMPPGKILEYARSFFPVFITVLCLRSFLIEPFRIPSGSLEPTLMVGDFVAVNKFIYGIRLPVLETKVLSVQLPKVSDIAVFRWPPDPSFDYIKRVIGTPGDEIQYHHKHLTVNGVKAVYHFVKDTVDESSGRVVAEYTETLGGKTHHIYMRRDVPASDFSITVPPHHYFMMGDNRDDSSDSRFWGFVEEGYLRGKALLVWMSWDNHLMTVRWSRLGRLIH